MSLAGDVESALVRIMCEARERGRAEARFQGAPGSEGLAYVRDIAERLVCGERLFEYDPRSLRFVFIEDGAGILRLYCESRGVSSA